MSFQKCYLLYLTYLKEKIPTQGLWELPVYIQDGRQNQLFCNYLENYEYFLIPGRTKVLDIANIYPYTKFEKNRIINKKS